MLDGARMRQVMELPDKSKVVTIWDLGQGKSLMLVPASKTATVLTYTKNRKDKTPESGGLFAFFVCSSSLRRSQAMSNTNHWARRRSTGARSSGSILAASPTT